jgi:hypothetical protein
VSSVQYAAVTSQKFTRPGLTLAPPAVTWAVSVTTVPVATELASLPFALTESDVTVTAFVWAEAAAARGNSHEKRCDSGKADRLWEHPVNERHS